MFGLNAIGELGDMIVEDGIKDHIITKGQYENLPY
jgi:hypothetical protein